MPLPKPTNDENQKDFISRCMGNENMKNEFKDNKQRVAVCYSLFKRKNENVNEISKLINIEKKLDLVDKLDDLQK